MTASPLSAQTEPQPYIRLAGVRREFADGTGLHATDLSIGRGEFVSVLGPSGCGKSTLLRCIAGLETPDAGTISFGNREVFSGSVNVPVNKRNLSMVFQDLALWPHMSVAGNVEFPLTTAGAAKKLGAAERKAAVDKALEMVGIQSKAQARPQQLSGGQQQRVAIARALVSSPDVLLMDEPLSALDAALRVQIRNELTQLAYELGLTVIYVTHDQAEALAMSDRVVVMNAGNVEQFDDPVTIYDAPATEFVAGFVGVMNRHESLPDTRPEDVQVSTSQDADVGAGRLPATVLSAHYVGGRYEVRCALDGAEEPWLVYARERCRRGDTIYLALPGR
ncbi:MULTISPECIES: ABC transporter ATP-binding protein [unclassified Corynebacterium]|uniref:ABC transporter ATP-binding protein n=1 Tax=unclassified Corynebacterium TaxID=2624378 RepID=UPI0034CF0448